jgi:hypothetical protein
LAAHRGTYITDKNKPKSLEDYRYLEGTKHYGDEDGMQYEVTPRLANQSGYIVASFRIPILSDGTKNRWEDTIPIHIEDIFRMTNTDVNSVIITRSVTDVSSSQVISLKDLGIDKIYIISWYHIYQR